jgi:hypothetical protein
MLIIKVILMSIEDCIDKITKLIYLINYKLHPKSYKVIKTPKPS